MFIKERKNKRYVLGILAIAFFAFLSSRPVQAVVTPSAILPKCACGSPDGNSTCSPPLFASGIAQFDSDASESVNGQTFAAVATSACADLSNPNNTCVFISQLNDFNPPDDPFTSEQITTFCEQAALPLRVGMCAKITNEADCKKIYGCFFANGQCKVGENLTVEEKKGLTTEEVNAYLKDRYGVPDDYTGPLPDCAFSGTCDDVNDLVQLAINVAKWLFGFLGMFALVMFVYGGFVWILSAGNAERVKHGRDILIAAIIGIIIAFGAYVLINFLLDALSVSSEFRFKVE